MRITNFLRIVCVLIVGLVVAGCGGGGIGSRTLTGYTVQQIYQSDIDYLDNLPVWAINNKGDVLFGGASIPSPYDLGGQKLMIIRSSGQIVELLSPEGTAIYNGEDYVMSETGYIAGNLVAHDTPVLWDPSGKPHALPRPREASACHSYGINDIGDVVGLGIVSGYYRAIKWSANGVVNLLDNENGFNESLANDINNKGVIVGWEKDTKGFYKAITWDKNGSVNKIGGLPADYSSGSVLINDMDQIVIGLSKDAESGLNCIIFNPNGTQVSLRPIEGYTSFRPNCINRNGESVGIAFNHYNTFDGKPVMWNSSGTPSDLSSLPLLPGTNRCDVNAINDLGQLAGVCYGDTASYVCVWTPKY